MWDEQVGAVELLGMVVVDPYGHRVGDVEHVVVEPVGRRVRALVVGSGGLVTLERARRLVPVEAVVDITDQVRIAPSHQTVHAGPSADIEPPGMRECDDARHWYGYGLADEPPSLRA